MQGLGDMGGGGILFADGHPPTDNFKRAVYRPPPPHFTIEMLSPTKQGGDFSYGMRITPVGTCNASVKSFRTAHQSYEIWRRWLDCLIFQDTLEMEYSRMARCKKQRLVAGKGVKKNGIYIHDQAASFESLPPGPDPNSVHLNIHDHLPKLTKKGTFFRTSLTTVQQRNKELTALFESLFDPYAPTLVKELRELSLVTDFFGFWRRDHDLELKTKRDADKQRGSVSSGAFSLYFSSAIGEDIPPSPKPSPSPSVRSHQKSSTSYSSTLWHPSSPPSLRSVSTQSTRPSTTTCVSPKDIPSTPSIRSEGIPSTKSRRPSTAPSAAPTGRFFSPASSHFSFRQSSRRSAHSPPSSSSSDDGSSRDSQGSEHLGNITTDLESTPIVFNPEQDNYHVPSERPLKTPVVEPSMKINDVFVKPSPRRENKPASLNLRPDNRNARVFDRSPAFPISPTESNSIQDEVSVFESDRSDRNSWMTTTSVTDYLEQLGLPLGSPDSEHSFRDSVATFRTDCSAEGVLGWISRPPHRRSLSSGRNHSTASICEEVSNYDSDADDNISISDILSSFPQADSAPSTPTRPSTIRLSNFFRPRAGSLSSTNTRVSLAPSTTSTTSSGAYSTTTFTDDGRSFTGTVSSTTTSMAEGSVAIKAAYGDAIVMLRVPKAISFPDLHRRLHDKFVRQENIPLGESFAIAQVIPSSKSTMKSAFAAERSARKSIAPQVCLIESEEDWQQVVMRIEHPEKLNLRLLDHYS